jgi:uncharacterized membrane protein
MIHFFKTFAAVLVPMLVIDGIWLTVIAKSFYAKHLGSLIAANPVWLAAGLFYVIYAIGIAYFIVEPATRGSMVWYQVMVRGALFGLVAYATYDLTNHASIQNWPAVITVVDLTWGTVITAVVSLIAWVVVK